MQPSQQKRTKLVDITELAFYQGSQGIPLQETLREIHAIHQKEQSAIQEESTHRQKPLEAIVEGLEHMQPRVELAWADIQNRVGIHPPRVFTAWVVAVLAAAAIMIDAILLGPGLDAVGISNPVVQYIAAFGLAALSSVIFHLVHETFGQSPLDTATKTVWRILGGFAVAALIGWGILRGYQIKFSADLNRNPLGNFLGNHPLLSSIFFCFITLAAPLVGAAAIFYAEPRIHAWQTWHRSRKAHDNLHATLSDAQKKLEAERAALRHKLDQFEAERTIWQASAAQYHARGDQRGARQVPPWLVALKAALWSLGGLALGLLAGHFFAPLYIVFPAAAGIGAFIHYRHRRFHPGYTEFKRQENTHFAVSTDRPKVELPDEPKLLPPPTEDQ